MSDRHVRVIVNPNAGSGGAQKRLGAIGDALRRYDLRHEIVLTRARGHATELARAATQDGVDVIAVVGGDGTLNEVAQAYVDEAGAPVAGPELAVVPAGTGGDFRKTLGLSGALDEAVGRIRHGKARAVDLGILHFTRADGERAVRSFVNIASFGIGGIVDRLVETGPKWLGGKAAFMLATFRAMAQYKNMAVRIRVDGEVWHEGPIFSVALANGKFFGGGMMIAPQADPSDGQLEVIALTDLSRASAAALSTKIYKGAHLGTEGVRVSQGVQIEAEPVGAEGARDSSVLIDLDGEQPGRLPLRATLARGALTFRS
jgi:YegS/Rv2252/BmrU family lipid kinase